MNERLSNKTIASCVDMFVCRFRIRNNMLYIPHATTEDRGTYRCVIQRPSGRLQTADAPLGLFN